jgi:hypothetical protein
MVPDKQSAITARELLGGLSLQRIGGDIEEIPNKVRNAQLDLDAPWYLVKEICSSSLENAHNFLKVGRARLVFVMHYIKRKEEVIEEEEAMRNIQLHLRKVDCL